MEQIGELEKEIKIRFDELRKEQQKIASLREKAKAEKDEAERQLKELDGRLPELLAGIALGRIPKFRGMKDLARIQKEQARLGTLIKQYPFLDKGLQQQEAGIPHRGSKIVAIENKLNEYKKVKAELADNPRTRHHDLLEARLLRLADDPALNCRKDAEAFLRKLKEPQTQKDLQVTVSCTYE